MPLTQQEIDSYNGTISSFGEAPTAARAKAVTGAMANPDQAAKSLELSRASGVHPDIVDLDHENFEEQWKQRTAGEAVAADPSLQEYINGHPLAAKVSNDDYPQLTRIGNAVKSITTHPLGEAWEGFKEGFGKPPTTEETRKRGYRQELGPEFAGIQELERSLKAPFDQSTLSPIDLFTSAFSGAIHGVARGAGTFLHNVSGGQISPDKAEREIGGLIEWAIMRGDINLAHGTPEFHAKVKEVMDHGLPYVKEGEAPAIGLLKEFDDAHKERAKADGKALKEAEREAAKSATKERSPDALEAFLRSPTEGRSIGISADAVQELYGDKPPAPDDGILGWVLGLEDKLRAAKAIGGDIEIPLAGWLAKTEPEVQNALHDHVRVRPDGMTLFEGKGPEARAKGLGVLEEAPKEGEILPPPKSGEFEQKPWTADDGNPWGMSDEDYAVWKTLPENKEAVERWNKNNKIIEFEKAETLVQNIDDLARKEASLAPLVESGQTLRLKLVKEEPAETVGSMADVEGLGVPAREVGDGPFRTYEIHGDRGKIGQVTAQLTNKKMIYIENIESDIPSSGFFFGANTFGPTQITSLLKQLKAEYPEATSIGGYRISGARAQAPGRELGKADATEFVQIPLRASNKDIASFAEAMGIAPERSPSILAGAVAGGADVTIGREVAKPLISLKTKDLLNHISLDHLEGIPRVLQSFYRDNLANLVGDIDVRVISREDMSRLGKEGRPDRPDVIPGFYHNEGKYIVLNEDLFTSDRALSYVAIHEADHAATVHVIENNPKLKANIRSVMEEIEQNYPEIAKDHAYAFQSEREFSAEGRSNPRLEKDLATTPLSDSLRQRLGLSADTKTMWDAVRNFIASIVEKWIGIRPEGTALEAMLKFYEQAEKEYKIQEIAEGKGMSFAPPQDPLFKNAKAIGYTKKRFEKMQELMAKQNDEDLARQQAKALRDAERRQTAEWKTEEGFVRDKVTQEVNQRPDIAADDFLREGPFTDVRTGRTRLRADALSDEQKASLPKNYYAKEGIDPTTLAGYFGFSSGEAVVQRLANLHAVREGLGFDPKEYKQTLVNQAVEREMQARFGDKEANILKEAREAIRTPTAMERLHQDTLALAEKAGIEAPLSLDDLKAAVKQDFNKNVSMPQARDPLSFIRAGARAGNLVQEALERGDWITAFKEKQRQTQAELYVREAFKLEKEYDIDTAFRKRHAKESLDSTEQEYLDHIHGILSRTGTEVKRGALALQAALAKRGSLESFVNERTDVSGVYLQTMPVADILYDPAFKKSVDQMTVEEFRAVRDSLKTIAKNGRDIKTATRAGEKVEVAKQVEEMKEKLKDWGTLSQKQIQREPGLRSSLRSGWSKLITVENTLDGLSGEDPKGVFNQLIANKMTDATRREMELTREHSNRIAEIKYKGKGLSETIENPFFIHQASGQPLIMDREMFLKMLQNVGNPSNLKKLVEGYEIQNPDMLMDWIKRTARKEDWEYVQAHGKAWEPLAKLVDELDERDSGLPMERIPLGKIDTGHPELGQIDGWYHPVIFDRDQPGKSKTLMGKMWDEMNFDKYYRASTPKGYQTKRTNYKQALSFNADVSSRIQQVIHDVAFREAIQDLSKFAYNTELRSALIRHVGPDFSKNFAEWVEAKAHGAQFAGKAMATMAPISNFFRQNAMTLYIGFNIGTVLKHGPTALVNSLSELTREFGPGAMLDFAKSTKNFFLEGPGGQTGHQFAMENSKEIPLRGRHWADQSAPAIRSTLPTKENWFFNVRDAMHHFGSQPVAWSDMISAGPMWNTAYRLYSEKGFSHGDAVTAADNLVVKAHGSITVKPLILNEISPWLTMVYGFWSNQFQRAVRLSWHAADAWDEGLSKGIGNAAKNTTAVAAETFSVLVWPMLVEEAVSPMVRDDHEGMLWKAAKGLTRLTSGFIPVVRDLVNAALRGSDPNTGMLGSLFKPGTDFLRNAESQFGKGRDRTANLVRFGLAAVGAMTGMVPDQVAKLAALAVRATKGEHPRKGFTGAKFEEPSTWVPAITGQNQDTWYHGIRSGKFKDQKK